VSAPDLAGLDPETEALFAALRRRLADRNGHVRDAIAQAKAALDVLGEAIRRDTLAQFARLNELDGPASGDTLDAAELAREAFDAVLALAGAPAPRAQDGRPTEPTPVPEPAPAPANDATAAAPEPEPDAVPPEPEFADSQFPRELRDPPAPKAKWVYTPPDAETEAPAAPEPVPTGGPLTPQQLPAVAAMVESGRKLLLVGGLYMEAKHRRVERAVGAEVEWVTAYGKTTPYAAVCAKVRGGGYGAVVICEGLAGHSQTNAVREACRDHGVPLAYAGTAGVGQIEQALLQLERIVAKGRRVA
jgi:hypothetical protein